MSNEEKREVICPITGVKHLIVHKDDVANIRALRKWATSLYIRMERGHHVILSMDCEGWKLGTIPNSLGLLQICEILDETILTDKSVLKNFSVGIKPGFLIHFPTVPAVIDILSGVFSHSNVVICTFDFTSDIASLQEAGVKINMNGIFDAQLVEPCSNPIQNTAVPSILYTARKMEHSNIKEAKDAVQFMSHMKGKLFEVLTFLNRNQEHPFDSMIDEHFYEYAAGDLVMTGLAVLYTYWEKKSDTTWNMTKVKVDEFNGYQRDYKNILQPSAIRQIAFIIRYNLSQLQEFSNHPTIDLKSEESIRKALGLYVNAEKAILLYKYLLPNDRMLFENIDLNKIKTILEKALAPITSRIENMSPLENNGDTQE